MTPLRILADQNIPEVHSRFASLGTVHTRPGSSIDRASLSNVDVLLVRSVTRVDASLLEATPVRFVGSATIGTDHVDLDYLQRAAITFAHAPGSNAGSVVEYVLAALFEDALSTHRPLAERTLGVVGYGNIGSRITARARALGLRVVVNDPPLEAIGRHTAHGDPFVPLSQLLRESDIVTVHVPYTTIGLHPTHHLLDESRLGEMRTDAFLINTSRGGVISGEALYAHVRRVPTFKAALDVFEDEPSPDIRLVQRLFLATPHIAGYSFDGKKAGTEMLYRAVCGFLGVEGGATPEENVGPRLLEPVESDEDTAWLAGLVRQMYDIRADDLRMRRLISLPEPERAPYFEQLRKAYPVRRAFEHHALVEGRVPDRLRSSLEQGLGVQIIARPTVTS